MVVAFRSMQIIRKIILLKQANTNANKSMRDGNNKKSHADYSTRFCLSFECFGSFVLFVYGQPVLNSIFSFYRTGNGSVMLRVK